MGGDEMKMGMRTQEDIGIESLMDIDNDGASIPVQLWDRARIVMSADINGNPYSNIAEFSKLFENNKIKGVNKKLKVPILITNHTIGYDVRTTRNASIAEQLNLKNMITFDLSINSDLELVAFNKKNLIKFFGYTELDAVNFIATMVPYGKFKMLRPISGLKLNIFCCTVSPSLKNVGGVVGLWSEEDTFGTYQVAESDMNLSRRSGKYGGLNLDEFPLKVVDLPLVLWREITADWLLEEKGVSAGDIERHSFNRHLVNMIRHCSRGYHQYWKLAETHKSSDYHDLAYELIMKEIWAKYPTLQSEVTRQLQNA